MKLKLLLPLAVAALTLTACGTTSTTSTTTQEVADTAPTQEKSLNIVTTFAPLYAHTLNIADADDTVTNLVPAGTSVHFWQPTPQDVATLENADIIVTNGLDLEEFLEGYLEDLEERGVIIVDTSTHVQTMEFEAHDEHDEHSDAHHDEDMHDDHHDDHEHEGEEHDDHHDHGHEDEHDEHVHDDHDDHHDEDVDHDEMMEEEHHDHGHHHHHDGIDPHIWLSVINAKEQTEAITEALIEANPADEAIYVQRSTEYQNKLTTLDEQVRAMVAAADMKPFVVFHDAYGYYLREYGLTDRQADIILENHNDTPTQAEIAELIEHIQEDGVATIFVEPQFSPTIVEALQQETGVQSREIDPIGSQMDADGYIANIRAITEAFTK